MECVFTTLVQVRELTANTNIPSSQRALCEKQQVNNSFEYIPIVKPTKRRGNNNGGENTFVRKITTTSLLSEQDPETENPTNKWQNKSQTP
jgi:hypothetical protein